MSLRKTAAAYDAHRIAKGTPYAYRAKALSHARCLAHYAAGRS